MTSDERVFAKAARRLIPFMGLLYLVSFLDRVNVGFAALTMNKDLGFTPLIFGWGTGIFFFGYFLFEVPSNVILTRVGAKVWICRIMATWGIVSAANAFIVGPYSFFALRFLLGAAEAGFFPGMVFYLSGWFPAALRARYAAAFFVAIPLASVVGAPLSGAIMQLDGVAGLTGWQWLFIAEGLPASLLAIAVYFYLPNGPNDAPWLDAEERAVIAARLAEETPHNALRELLPALIEPRVIVLSLVYFGIVIGLYGIGFWLPQMVSAMGYSTFQTSFIVAIPYAVAALGMVLWSRSSDARGERVAHVAWPSLLSAAAFLASAVLQSPLLVMFALTLAALGIYATLAPFWAMPPLFLRGTAAAGGIAVINAVGNLGGYAGPLLVGWIKQTTGSYSFGMVVLSAALLAASMAVMLMERVKRTALVA